MPEPNEKKPELAVLAQLLKSVDVDKLAALLGNASLVVESGGPVKVDSDVGVDGVDAPEGSSSGQSWADEVESEVSSVAGVPVISDVVKRAISFGGFGVVETGSGSQMAIRQADAKQPGAMSQYVRTDAARGLKAVLRKYGVKMPKQADWHVAMVTHTAATMPAFFASGKDKLRTMAVLGDASLVAAVAAEAVAYGHGLESVQKLRTTLLSDVVLSKTFADSEFAKFVTSASGVDVRYAKTGATALEAIFGLIAFYRSPADVVALARALNLVTFS